VEKTWHWGNLLSRGEGGKRWSAWKKGLAHRYDKKKTGACDWGGRARLAEGTFFPGGTARIAAAVKFECETVMTSKKRKKNLIKRWDECVLGKKTMRLKKKIES